MQFQLRTCKYRYVRPTWLSGVYISTSTTKCLQDGSHQIGSRARLNKLNSQDCSIAIGAETVTLVDVVGNLGVFLDCEQSMKQHIAKVLRRLAKCVLVSEKT